MMVNTNAEPSKIARLRTDKSNRDFAAMVALGGLLVGGISLLFQVFMFFAYVGLASKPAPSLVQMTDGQAMNVGAMPTKDRIPEVVRRFVTDSLILLMSWSNNLPSQTDVSGNPKLMTDPGVKVSFKGGEKRITTAAFQASFTFAENFRNDLVKLVADMTPDDVFNGQVQTALIFQSVTVPEKLEDGKWKVAIVGTLVKSKIGTGDTDRVTFNKEVILQAVDTPSLPQDGKFSNPFEAAVYSIRQAGLEIVSMRDLDGSAVPQANILDNAKSEEK